MPRTAFPSQGADSAKADTPLPRRILEQLHLASSAANSRGILQQPRVGVLPAPRHCAGASIGRQEAPWSIGAVLLGSLAILVAQLVRFLPASSEPGGRAELAAFYFTGVTLKERRATQLGSLLGRVQQIVRSNVSAFQKSRQNPEEVMAKVVEEMRADLSKLRLSYADVSDSLKRIEARRAAAADQVAQWQRSAEIAVAKGEDALAREVLARKRQAQGEVDQLTAQLLKAQSTVDDLARSIQLTERELEEAGLNRAQLLRRISSLAPEVPEDPLDARFRNLEEDSALRDLRDRQRDRD
eukprot:EG_transcript_17597